MSVDLTKIQSVIETEVEKAITMERRRIVAAVAAFSKDLVEEIKRGGDESDDGDETPVKAKPVVKPKEVPTEESDPEFDISEVTDDEVSESDYSQETAKTLRAECKKRDLGIPKGYAKVEIVKLLILHDESEE